MEEMGGLGQRVATECDSGKARVVDWFTRSYDDDMFAYKLSPSPRPFTNHSQETGIFQEVVCRSSY